MPHIPPKQGLIKGLLTTIILGGMVALKFPWSLKAEGERGEGRGRIPKAVADGTLGRWGNDGDMMWTTQRGEKNEATGGTGGTLPLFFGDSLVKFREYFNAFFEALKEKKLETYMFWIIWSIYSKWQLMERCGKRTGKRILIMGGCPRSRIVVEYSSRI